MKKLISVFLSMLILFGFAACSGNKTNGSAESSSTELSEEQQVSSISEASAAEPSSAASEGSQSEPQPQTGKILVVYFSASGNTKRVAENIAGAAEADLFELVPTEAYTDGDLDWTVPESRVNHEHDDESLRDIALVSTEVPDWDTYETVFIGYPIWWGIAAWPVDGFIKANDFTGKTVIPFATSASSGIGESGKLLAELAGTGDWQEGKRFSSGASAEDVQAWVGELALS